MNKDPVDLRIGSFSNYEVVNAPSFSFIKMDKYKFLAPSLI